MSQPDNKDLNPKQSLVDGIPVIALGGQIGCVTIFILLVAVVGGVWLDQLLGTKPAITVALILAAAPLSLVITYWMAMRTIRKINTPQLPIDRTRPFEEEDIRE
jgi:hypothetical protein